jgi:hypothetical protein
MFSNERPNSPSTIHLSFISGRVSKPPLAKPMSLALENTATYILVNNTLDMAFL